jgi:hypothetical protein
LKKLREKIKLIYLVLSGKLHFAMDEDEKDQETRAQHESEDDEPKFTGATSDTQINPEEWVGAKGDYYYNHPIVFGFVRNEVNERFRRTK